MDSGGSFLNVAVRIKPTARSNNDENVEEEGCWHVDGNTITQVINSTGAASFTVDRIFEAASTPTNRIVYEALGRRLVELAVQKGINATMFAYGQTSTGKTWTMMGSESDPGVIPLALHDLFSFNTSTTETPTSSSDEEVFTVKASYLEIYNEVISDLLDRNNTNLKVHETPERGVFVGKLSEWVVTSSHDALVLLQRGEENRKIGCTNMNERSSRSHTIFQLSITSRPKDPKLGGRVRSAILTFVDLAGSERVGQTGAEGLRLKEGGHINKSLLALTSVVSKLAEPTSSEEFIPYRDSKLTRILQPALGGNSATAVLCAVSPSPEFVDETLSTLKFAIRARSIRNVPTTNEIVIPEAKTFRLEKENISLKRRIAEIEEQQEESKRARKLALDDRLSNYSARLTSLSSSLKELLLIANHTFADITASNGNLRKKLMHIVTLLSESKNFAQVELSTLSQIAQATEEELQRTKQEKESLLLECAKLGKELEERPSIMDDQGILTKELLELNDYVQILGEKCDVTMEKLSAQIMTERSRADRAEVTLAKTEDLLRAKEIDIEQLLNKLTQVQQDARRSGEEMNQRVQDLETEVLTYQKESKRMGLLEEELEKHRKELQMQKELEVRHQKVRDELEKVKASLEQTIQAKTSLEEENNANKSQIQEFTKSLLERDAQLERQQTELSNLNAVLKERTESISILESKVEQRHHLLETLKQTHVEELKTLMLKLTTTESALSTKQDELLNAKSEFEVKLGNLQKENQELHKQNALLLEELECNKASLAEQSLIISKLETNRSEIDDVLLKKERELEETRMDLQMIKSSLKTRQENHERSIEELSKVRQKLQRLEESDTSSSNSTVLLEKQLLKTRLELERTREQFTKEKRLMTLRIAEMEEELIAQQNAKEAKENLTPNNKSTFCSLSNLNTTPTSSSKTKRVDEDSEQTPPSAVKQTKNTTPKQQFKYRSFLSPSQNNATPEPKKITTINNNSNTENEREERKKTTPECAQQ